MRLLIMATALLALTNPAAAQTPCRYYEGPVPTEDATQPAADGSFAVFGDQKVTIQWADGSKQTCNYWFDDTMIGTVDCLGGKDAPRKSLLAFGGAGVADADQSRIALMNGVFWYRDPKCPSSLNSGM